MRRLLAAAAEAARGVRPGTSAAACCVFAEDVLRRAFGSAAVDAIPRARWRIIRDDPAYGLSVSPWEPVYAARDAGLTLVVAGAPAPSTPPPAHRWCLVQGWRGEPFAAGVTGHTFLFYRLDEDSDDGLVVDSSEASGPRVPREGPISWAEIVRPYVGGVAVAVLRPVPTRSGT